MHVVRHDDECVPLDHGKSLWQPMPHILYRQASSVQCPGIVDDVARKASALISADCHKKRTGLTVVISMQADGAAVVKIGIIGH